jgi:IS30 family transposase
LGWSPEQISGRLKIQYNIKISYELIYQYIDRDRKAGGSLYKYLPHRGKKYKKRNIKTRKRVWKTAAKRKPKSKRPPEATERKEIGHWEGDTIEGKRHQSGLGTFVDRKSTFTIIRKVRNKSAEEMKNVILKSFNACPDVIKTLTVDNGGEFALHDKISISLGMGVYFAPPYSPWERGLNENVNGLIRRFFPKGTDFKLVPEWEVTKVQNLLNERPRKNLGFKTPKEVFISELMKQEKYQKLVKVC